MILVASFRVPVEVQFEVQSSLHFQYVPEVRRRAKAPTSTSARICCRLTDPALTCAGAFLALLLVGDECSASFFAGNAVPAPGSAKAAPANAVAAARLLVCVLMLKDEAKHVRSHHGSRRQRQWERKGEPCV